MILTIVTILLAILVAAGGVGVFWAGAEIVQEMAWTRE